MLNTEPGERKPHVCGPALASIPSVNLSAQVDDNAAPGVAQFSSYGPDHTGGRHPHDIESPSCA